MEELITIFYNKLSLKSATYIKHLRLERQLDYINIYKISTYTFRELKVANKNPNISETIIGYSLYEASLKYLDNIKF